MKIRALLEYDATAWWRLRLEALANEPFAFGKAVEEHRHTRIETIARRFGEAPEGDFTLGTFENEELVATATFIRDKGLKERHKGRIFGVYVTSAHRRKGIGRALLVALLERAKRDSSLEQVLVSVATGQTAARQLYRGLGFQTYGTEPDALKIGTRYVGEDHMILRVR